MGTVPKPSLTAVVALLAACAGSACTHDVVLPDQVTSSVCGNGVMEADEECDVKSPGCIDCQVQPEWTCTATGCSILCVDGVVGSDSSCSDPHRDTACDLSGFWAVRETTYLLDQVFQTVQTSSNWYLYEIAQTGDAFTITASLDCGVHVTGSATIDYPPSTSRGLIWLNPEDGTDPTRGQRPGTSTPTSDGSGCAVTLGPWYFVRGVTTSYLPPSFASDVAIETLEPLPSVTDPVNGNVFPIGATDPTTVGIPGVGALVSGLIPGVRYSAQRSTTSFATMPSSTVPAAALTVVIPGLFDVQENVLRVTECGDACAILTTLATPTPMLPPHTTWQFIGKTLGSARVAPIVVAAPRADIDLDLMTCANVQALLPHDPTHPTL
jgi:hypothetical protein